MKIAFLLAMVAGPVAAQDPATTVVVASKAFTEAVVLGEVAAGVVRDAGYIADHRQELGGTRVLFNALLRGDIDVYGEYTGTIIQELLAELNLETEDQARAALRERGILMTRPLGFNNSYAIAMRPGTADSLGVSSISDLREHPEVRFGMSNEFMDPRRRVA